jgi:polyhydroxyalkanoate synthesis regulator phasin
MIQEFKSFLTELQSDNTEFSKKLSAKLEKYIKQNEAGEITDNEFLSFISDLVDLQEIQSAYLETKTKVTLQKIIDKAQKLLSIIPK